MAESELLWEQPAWLREAQDWIAQALAERGMAVSGPVEQVLSRYWSTILRVPVGSGVVYFKASIPLLAGEARLLASAYEHSLRLAEEAGDRSVAFPCISTGAYGYPKPEACDVAVTAVERWLAEHPLPETVFFCCFDRADFALYERRLGREGAAGMPERDA